MAATVSYQGCHASGLACQQLSAKPELRRSTSAVKYIPPYAGEKVSFQSICNQWTLERGPRSLNGGQAEEYPSPRSCETTQPMVGPSRTGNRKRRVLADNGFKGDDDDDGGEERKNKRLKRSEDIVKHPGRLTFACPFYKSDPGSCPKPGWPSITHLKKHLFESQCLRCCESFHYNEDLVTHQRTEPSCTLKPFDARNPSSTLQKQMEEVTNDGTELEMWYALWRILFPGTPAPSSPYYDEPGGISQTSKLTENSQSESDSDSSDASQEAIIDAFRSPRLRWSSINERHSTNNLAASIINEREDSRPPQPRLSRVLRGVEPKLWVNQSSEDRELLLSEIICYIDVWLAFRQNKSQQGPRQTASETDGDQRDGPQPGLELAHFSRSLPAGNRHNTGARNKRKRNRLPDEDDQKDDDNGGGPKPPGNEVLGFACPFRNRFPLIYGNKKQCLGWWPSVHRLKEHLYRQHLQPISCARCSETFHNPEALESHQRTSVPCVVKERQPIDGIQPKQERLLRSKRKMGNTEYEKCQAVYRTIWPGLTDEEMPCPYWNLSEIAQQPLLDQSSQTEHLNKCEKFLAREMPALLGNMLEDELQGHDIITKERILSIVEEAQTKLFHKFRSAGFTSPSASLSVVAKTEGPQRLGPIDLEASQLSIPDSVFADLDMSQIDACIDQYLGQDRAGANAARSSREVDGAYDKSQYQYMDMPGLHLPMLEGYGTAMLLQDIGLGVGT